MNLRISKVSINNLSIAFFLLLVLFLPNTDSTTRLYFAAMLVSIPLLLGNTKKLHFDYIALTGVGILVLHVIFTLLRFGFIVEPNLRDYTEFARLLLPVLMLIFRDKFKDLSLHTIFTVFAFYAGIDCFVSILDFLNVDILGIVNFTNSLYVSKFHAEIGSRLRINGFSAGPAQHGIKMLVIYTFFYCRIFQSRKILLPLIFSFISAFPIFLSQSRTSMIAFALISLGVAFFYLFFGAKSTKRRSIPVLASLIGGSIFLLTQFQDFFSRLFELLRGIEAVSSYQDRVEGYKMLFDKAMEYPAFLALGYGKNFFQTSVFDNEYLLMFFVYGPIISLLLIVGILSYLVVFLQKNKKAKYEYSTMLFFLLLAGLLIAYPATFFLQTGVIPLLFTFANLAYWENIRLNGSHPTFENVN